MALPGFEYPPELVPVFGAELDEGLEAGFEYPPDEGVVAFGAGAEGFEYPPDDAGFDELLEKTREDDDREPDDPPERPPFASTNGAHTSAPITANAAINPGLRILFMPLVVELTEWFLLCFFDNTVKGRFSYYERFERS